MPLLIKLVQGTPLWVWGIFAYLLFVGVRGTKKRVVWVPQLFIIPVILISLKYKFFLTGGINVFAYLAAMLGGMVGGILVSKRTMLTVLKKEYSIELEGDYSLLFLLLTFFAIKYFFGMMQSIAPLQIAPFLICEAIISGCVSGYLLGRNSGYAWRFLKGY